MARERTTKTLLVIGLLAAVGLLALPATSPAQQEGHHPEGDKADTGMMGKKPDMPMMAHMKTMAKLKELLAEAKGAAEAEGDKVAASKIGEALGLIEQDHKAMHQHMQQMMQKMKQRMETMQAMEKDMGKMKEDMGKKEGTKPMQQKMEQMKQKMQKMHEERKSEAKAGEKTCPMCKKMMAGEPKAVAVNARCPIMGNKIDPSNVPENLTREWNGKTVGFCCAACPPKWDKLSDEEKQAKLDAAMAESETPKDSGEHKEHHGG